MSKCGLAMLFDRAGGSLTASMRDVIAILFIALDNKKYAYNE
jgi:hypothetical protein